MNVFPYRVLGLGVWVMLWLKTGLRLGQMAIAPRVGRWIDRWGNRPAMAVSLTVVAQASLFYFLATPQRPWWIAGAWALWIAWVGLNIGQPNLMLKLAPGRANTSYIAVWFTATGLCYAASTALGGTLFDRFGEFTLTVPGGFHLDYYREAFWFDWATRCLGVALLWLAVAEPASGGRLRR